MEKPTTTAVYISAALWRCFHTERRHGGSSFISGVLSRTFKCSGAICLRHCTLPLSYSLSLSISLCQNYGCLSSVTVWVQYARHMDCGEQHVCLRVVFLITQNQEAGLHVCMEKQRLHPARSVLATLHSIYRDAHFHSSK